LTGQALYNRVGLAPANFRLNGRLSKGEHEGMKDRKSAGPRTPTPGEPAAESNKPQLSPEIQGKIGQQLRKIYDDMVNQGVPDRFADLLDRLDKPNDSESR
jgi:hypothetical protein